MGGTRSGVRSPVDPTKSPCYRGNDEPMRRTFEQMGRERPRARKSASLATSESKPAPPESAAAAAARETGPRRLREIHSSAYMALPAFSTSSVCTDFSSRLEPCRTLSEASTSFRPRSPAVVDLSLKSFVPAPPAGSRPRACAFCPLAFRPPWLGLRSALS